MAAQLTSINALLNGGFVMDEPGNQFLPASVFSGD
jgi:hypothetical protein